MIPHGARATPQHELALCTPVALAALPNNLRPDTRFALGAPAEVDPIPPSGFTSAPLLTFPVWRPR